MTAFVHECVAGDDALLSNMPSHDLAELCSIPFSEGRDHFHVIHHQASLLGIAPRTYKPSPTHPSGKATVVAFEDVIARRPDYSLMYFLIDLE